VRCEGADLAGDAYFFQLLGNYRANFAQLCVLVEQCVSVGNLRKQIKQLGKYGFIARRKFFLAGKNGPGYSVAQLKLIATDISFRYILTNMLNPKIALFFLAFLPQFVDADAAHKSYAFALLGIIFVFNGTLWCLAIAAFAAKAAQRMRQSSAVMHWINRGIGALFVYLGVRVALFDAR